MRKADYQTLAQTIATERTAIMHRWFDDEKERLRHVDTLRRVAEGFAMRASVDKPAFLKACGIDT